MLANTQNRIVQGLEGGPLGYGIRGVVPVVYQGATVGTFEFGLDFGDAILEDLKAEHQAEFTVYLCDPEAKNEDGTAAASPFVLYASTFDEALTLDEAVRQTVFADDAPAHLPQSVNPDWALLVAPLQNYAGEPVGVIEVAMSRAAAQAQLEESRWTLIGIRGVLLVLAGLLLWQMILRTVIRPLQQAGASFETIARGAKDSAVRVDEAHRAVAAMRAASEDLERAVAEAARIAAENTQIAAMMGGLTETVVSGLDSVSAVVEENTAATEEMSANAGEVTQAIESIASVSEENSAAVEQVAASADEMNTQVGTVRDSAQSLAELARALQSDVALFRLDGGHNRAPTSMHRSDVVQVRASQRLSIT